MNQVLISQSEDGRTKRALEAVTHQVTGVVTGVVTGEVAGEALRPLSVLRGEMGRQEIEAAVGLEHEKHFREAYLIPALVTLLRLSIRQSERA